jgi:hypothetical protein
MMLKPDYTHLGDSQASQVSGPSFFRTFTYFSTFSGLILLFDEDDLDIVTPSWTTSFFELTDIQAMAYMIYVSYPILLVYVGISLLLVLIGIITILGHKS